MTSFYLYDDARARQFEPFASTRPLGELRVATRLIRERWQTALGVPCGGFVSHATLADFEEPGAPAAAGEVIPAGSIVVNARCAPRLASARTADVLRCGDRVAAVRLASDLPSAALADGTTTLETLAGAGTGEANAGGIAGWWLEEVWDLLRDLESRLREDLELLSAGLAPVVPAAPVQTAVVGRYGVFAAADAIIEPFVTFDCTNGPVVIETGATVQSFTRVQGPTWIGPHSIVGGDKVTVCAIGDTCKVHGEVSNAIFVGHANKAHDGFVGQSYLGRWVNLGANTVTSNLKNTYGSVSLWTPSGIRDTGQQFLGTLFGDHAKTGIGLTLTTGTVVGAGAQIYGSEMPPKVVPPFAWGDTAPYETFQLEKFLLVAERVMSRRHVALTDRGRAYLRRVFESRWSAER